MKYTIRLSVRADGHLTSSEREATGEGRENTRALRRAHLFVRGDTIFLPV